MHIEKILKLQIEKEAISKDININKKAKNPELKIVLKK